VEKKKWLARKGRTPNTRKGKDPLLAPFGEKEGNNTLGIRRNHCRSPLAKERGKGYWLINERREKTEKTTSPPGKGKKI